MSQAGTEMTIFRGWNVCTCIVCLALGGCGAEVPDEDLGRVVYELPEIPPGYKPYQLPDLTPSAGDETAETPDTDLGGPNPSTSLQTGAPAAVE